MRARVGLILICVVIAAHAQPSRAETPENIATTICAQCHGPDGYGVDPQFPRLAGLQANYIVKQLREFASGERRSDEMATIVADLAPEAFAGLGEWYFALPPAPGTPPATPDRMDDGRQLYEDGNVDTGVPSCSGCHQSDGAGNNRFPRLAGQSRQYLVKQLADFKTGRRGTDRLMVSVAQRMTEQEIEAAADYIAAMTTKGRK